MERLIISAPFGNHLSFPGTTPTLGTFTLEHRGGFWRRVWRCLRTLRYNRRQQSWINKLGLPNPGIHSLDLPDDGVYRIVSVHGFCLNEWNALVRILRSKLHGQPGAIEFNLSCPNVGHRPAVVEVESAVRATLCAKIDVIAKLPPVRWLDWAEPLFDMGVRSFHCCNTIPTPGGGISGKPLKQYSLWAVEDIKNRCWPNKVRVIGGGGVTCAQDVRDYLSAGADHVAVGSTLLNPLNWRKVSALVEAARVKEEIPA